MFRVKHAIESSLVLWVTAVLLCVMILATGATVWLVAEVRKEQQVIQAIVRGGVAEDIARLGSLPGEVRWQLWITLLVLLVLIIAGSGLVFVGRAHLKSLSFLGEIKNLAWDILASMDQGVITTDRDGKITSVNPRGQQLLGWEYDCIGRPLDGLSEQELPLAAASREVLATGQTEFDREFSVIRNGHPIRLRAECHVLRGKHDEIVGTVLHFRDVTERILIEERIRRMERFMELGTLAAGLHHEIKNPLSALSLHVQLLEERLEARADAETMDLLSVLTTEVERINNVLESFRDYASTESLSRADIDIGAMVQHTIDLIRPQAEQQGVRVAVSMPDSDLPLVRADATRLEQVLLNLVLNALDEMREGGTLSLQVTAEADRITLGVSDTGRGVPDNLRARIFDPYFTTKSQGSGMGLAVSEKIVRQHGGQIDVATETSGATFRVSLPLEIVDG